MIKQLLAVAIVVASIYTASAQQASERIQTEESGGQLAGIRVALERLVELREAEATHSHVDSILKQMDVWLKRVAPIEYRLSKAEDEFRSAENNLTQLERMKEQHEAQRDLDIEMSRDSPNSEARRMLADIERSRLSYEERADATRLRIQEYENERTRLLRRVETLEELLLDRLDENR